MKTSPLILALLAANAVADGPALNTGYRCTGADGSISFQDKPCASGQKSQSFEYQRQPPPPPAEPVDPALAEAEAQAKPETPPIPAPPPPRPPAPVMYQCVRADNEKIYYSETGETRPYQVPAGVLGLPGSKLGASDGVSAPELNRPPVAAPGGSSAIAAAYVEVQDRCVQMSPAEGCRVLRAQLDENLARQRSVGKAEREGMAVEAHRLADKLAGC